MLSLFLFLAALLGGALNAVAGGGSFITLPALLYAGVPPVVANATNALALWPASVASMWAFRCDVSVTRPLLLMLSAISIVGGLIGGRLLVDTSDAGFMTLLPWLMLLAAVTFTFGGRIPLRVSRNSRDISFFPLLLMFPIAVYGGYFGGGMGIMILAAFSLAGMTKLHEMNGIKAMLSAIINGVAMVEFILLGTINWPPGLVMVAGSIVGGYAGALVARRSDERLVRTFITVIAWTLTVFFFLR